MKRLTNWIKKHQVIAFYLIAYGITFGLGWSYDAVMNQDKSYLLPLTVLAICGPGLAGILISALTNTKERQGSGKPFWFAFVISGVLGVSIFAANLKFFDDVVLSSEVIAVLIVSVIPVAFIIASAYSRNPSVKGYLSSLVRLKGVWGWALLALVLVPAVVLISAPASIFLNGNSVSFFQYPELSWTLVGLVVLKLFYQLFFFNATGEETGWRGFVMPRLQSRFSPLVTALIIGIFWASWHFLFWKADGNPVTTWSYWLEMWVAHSLFSVVVVWICNRARGNILVAGIAHAATNTVQAFVYTGGLVILVLFVEALILVVLDRMWKKLPQDHPAVYREQPEEIEVAPIEQYQVGQTL